MYSGVTVVNNNRSGIQDFPGGANLLFCKCCRKNLDREEGARVPGATPWISHCGEIVNFTELVEYYF